MSEEKTVNITFELVGDAFPHAWFFNKFRVEKLGDSTLATFGLATEAGGIPEVNAIVLSESDIQNNKERGLTFLGRVGDVPAKSNPSLAFAVPPKRVYPVNHITFSRANFLSRNWLLSLQC